VSHKLHSSAVYHRALAVYCLLLGHMAALYEAERDAFLERARAERGKRACKHAGAEKGAEGGVTQQAADGDSTKDAGAVLEPVLGHHRADVKDVQAASTCFFFNRSPSAGASSLII
jgi:hypothetical protein